MISLLFVSFLVFFMFDFCKDFVYFSSSIKTVIYPCCKCSGCKRHFALVFDNPALHLARGLLRIRSARRRHILRGVGISNFKE